jgi:protocatechuate 3,4-dioxygenase beta subunit
MFAVRTLADRSRRTALVVGIVALVVLGAVLWPHSESGAAASAAISGTITDENTGAPLSGICVEVVDSSYVPFGYDVTDALGSYTTSGLPAGDYKMRLQDCNEASVYLTEWYNDQPDFDHANLVAVAEKAQLTGINIALGPGGTISGTITDENTGHPLPGICVTAHATFYDWSSAHAHANVSGSYSLDGLYAGQYKVHFEDCHNLAYAPEWYDDEGGFDSAHLVTVAAKEKTAVDAALAFGGTISGTVTHDSTGLPAEGIYVEVFDTLYDRFGHDLTDDSGRYRVGALPTGDYKVRFGGGYVTEWYSDQPDFDSADLVGVTEKEETMGIDAAVRREAAINGIVTSENTGAPLGNILVKVYDTSRQLFGAAFTDGLGYYGVSGLPTGEYKVYFKEWGIPEGGSDHAYVSEWYNDQPNFDSADLVAATENETITIDAALPLGGIINGTVIDENTREPVEDICVFAYQSSYNWLNYSRSDASGNYSVGALPTGNYKVHFGRCILGGERAYLTEWYNDQPDFDSADIVAVAEKEETMGIDAALTLGGIINGTVIDENTGEPLEELTVEVYDGSHHEIGSGSTGASGSYSIVGLPSGDYKLLFHDAHLRGYFPEWYDDRPDFGSATLVTVTEKEKTVVDAALANISVDFSIGVAGAACGTSGGGSECDVALGGTFTLSVYLNSLPSLITAYEGLDVYLQYDGVSSKDNADMLSYWDDCVFEMAYYEPGLAAFACATFGDSSTYTGLVAAIDFNCDMSGTITMVGTREGATQLAAGPLTYREGADEALTINCAEGPAPTPTPPPIGGIGTFPGAAGADASHGDIGSVLGIALAPFVAAAIALGSAAWFASRRVKRC